MLKEKKKNGIGSLMLVSLSPKPVFYTSATSCQQTLPIRIIPQPLTEELKNKGKTKKNFVNRGKKRGAETQRDMQNQTPTKITFNSAEKCKTLDIKCQRAR